MIDSADMIQSLALIALLWAAPAVAAKIECDGNLLNGKSEHAILTVELAGNFLHRVTFQIGFTITDLYFPGCRFNEQDPLLFSCEQGADKIASSRIRTDWLDEKGEIKIRDILKIDGVYSQGLRPGEYSLEFNTADCSASR